MCGIPITHQTTNVSFAASSAPSVRGPRSGCTPGSVARLALSGPESGPEPLAFCPDAVAGSGVSCHIDRPQEGGEGDDPRDAPTADEANPLGGCIGPAMTATSARRGWGSTSPVARPRRPGAI